LHLLHVSTCPGRAAAAAAAAPLMYRRSAPHPTPACMMGMMQPGNLMSSWSLLVIPTTCRLHTVSHARSCCRRTTALRHSRETSFDSCFFAAAVTHDVRVCVWVPTTDYPCSLGARWPDHDMPRITRRSFFTTELRASGGAAVSWPRTRPALLLQSTVTAAGSGLDCPEERWAVITDFLIRPVSPSTSLGLSRKLVRAAVSDGLTDGGD